MRPKKNKTLTSAQELFIFHCYENGESIAELSDAYSVPRKDISESIDRYKKLGTKRPRYRAFKPSTHLEGRA